MKSSLMFDVVVLALREARQHHEDVGKGLRPVEVGRLLAFVFVGITASVGGPCIGGGSLETSA